MRGPGKDFPDMLQKPSTLSVSSWLYIDFEAKIMALSESFIAFDWILLLEKHVRVSEKNMYVFFCKSRTCFLDKVMAFFNVLIISVLFERF